MEPDFPLGSVQKKKKKKRKDFITVLKRFKVIKTHILCHVSQLKSIGSIFQTLDIACQEAFLKVDELSDVDLVDFILRLE